MTREDIVGNVAEILSETFELQREQITPDALLARDLDSIDAVEALHRLTNDGASQGT